jgi:predicted ATPase
VIGRRAELAEIRASLREHRHVTVVGPAGVGKTTVARALDGTLCRVEGCVDHDDVMRAIARSFSIATTADPTRAVERTLQDIALLVLDGAEHLALGPLVARLLAAVPTLRIVTTSREPVEGAHIVHLAPFPADAARELWERTVRRELPDYRVAHDDAGELDTLLAALDGLPLAIELAAARRATLTPRALEAELSRGLTLLCDRRRPLDRHASLQAALDASHRLLDERSRTLLAQLAVFPDMFDAPSIRELVTDDPEWLDRFERLVDQSWVMREVTSDSVPLFRLLHTIRAYVRERDGEEVARAEAEFVRRVQACAPLWDDQAIRGDTALVVRHGNDLRLAGERLASEASIPVLAALAHLTPHGLGSPRDAALFDRALAEELSAESRAQMLFAKALVARASRDVATVRALADEAAALATDPVLAGRALHVRGAIAIEAGEPEAGAILARARSLLPGDLSEAALVSTHLAILEQRAARHREAAEILRAALPIARGDARATAIVLSVLGAVYGELQEPDEGRRCLAEAIELSRGRDVRTFAYACSCFGALLHAIGDLEGAAARLTDAVVAWTRANGEMYAAFSEETLGVVRAELGQRADARRHLERAIQNLGTAGYVFALLGRAHIALLDLEDGDDERGRERFASVMAELTEDNPFREAILCLNAAFDASVSLPHARSRTEKMDVRVAVRRVRQVLDARRATIARDGSAIAGQSLRHRPQLVRLLAALIEGPQTVEALVARVWPDEKILPDAARTRLYAAVRRLRTIGLGDALIQTEGGYRLDESRVRIQD